MYQNNFAKSSDVLNDEEVNMLFDGAMENLKKERPKLDFRNEKEAFKKENDFYPHMFLLDSALKSLGNEKVFLVQTLDDLTKIKDMYQDLNDEMERINAYC